jgi:hypothetical protein
MRAGRERADAAGFVVMRRLRGLLGIDRRIAGSDVVTNRLIVARSERHLRCKSRGQDKLESEYVGDGDAHKPSKPNSGPDAEHPNAPYDGLAFSK